jgi:hypothetical protein
LTDTTAETQVEAALRASRAIGGDLVGFALELLKVELAGVVKRLPGHTV